MDRRDILDKDCPQDRVGRQPKGQGRRGLQSGLLRYGRLLEMDYHLAKGSILDKECSQGKVGPLRRDCHLSKGRCMDQRCYLGQEVPLDKGWNLRRSLQGKVLDRVLPLSKVTTLDKEWHRDKLGLLECHLTKGRLKGKICLLDGEVLLGKGCLLGTVWLLD